MYDECYSRYVCLDPCQYQQLLRILGSTAIDNLVNGAPPPMPSGVTGSYAPVTGLTVSKGIVTAVNTTPPATPGFVSGHADAGQQNVSAGNLAITLSFTPTVGNFLVLAIGTAAADMVPSPPAPWVPTPAISASAPGGSTNIHNVFLFYMPNCPATTSWTVPCTGTYAAGWAVAEFQGIATPSPLDQSTTVSGTGQSVPDYSTPATAQPVELAISVIGARYEEPTPAGPTNGFTFIIAPTSSLIALAYNITSSAGPVTTGWTSLNLSISDGYAGGIATFLTV